VRTSSTSVGWAAACSADAVRDDGFFAAGFPAAFVADFVADFAARSGADFAAGFDLVADFAAGLAPGFGAAARLGAAAALRPRVRFPAAGSVAAPSRGAGTPAESVAAAGSGAVAGWDGAEVMPSACW
jgi:hypothetical protein